jgi:branched-chain amino acid transport system permease protein
VRSIAFFFVALAVGAAVFAAALIFNNEYVFFAGYTVLHFVVLATAWNILGGYCGYVNFGSAAFFALGAYSTVFLHKTYPLPIPLLILIGGTVSGIVGLGTGYLTLRLRGAFFAIATLALAVVLQTLVMNWDYVGGARGAYVIRPNSIAVGPWTISYMQYLFATMLVLAVVALTTARLVERSRLGYGFAAIRDDELAAEACGVPTLRLKLIATTLSGAFMGMAGAPFPYYIGYLQPSSAFGLEYAVNSIAMPMIGGTTSWVGPLVGALLLGTLQQIATVTISSHLNLLIVGLLLVGFVIAAPNGIVGLVRNFLRIAAPLGLDKRALGLILLAIYAFLSGIFGIVLGLAALMGGRSGLLLVVGILALVLAVLYLASFYGLLTIQPWSPAVALAAFGLSLPLAAASIAMDHSSLRNTILEGITVVVALFAVWMLRRPEVAPLYKSDSAPSALIATAESA